MAWIQHIHRQAEEQLQMAQENYRESHEQHKVSYKFSVGGIMVAVK